MTTHLTLRSARRAATHLSAEIPRATTNRAPIISRPRAAALPARIGWQLVCALLWSAWLICWGPLLTFAIWQCGLVRVQATLAQTNGLHYLQQMLVYGCLVIAVQSVCLLGWAAKDYWRFGVISRRQRSANASISELAHYAQLPSAGLAQWQLARCVVAEHNDLGNLFTAHLQQLPNTAFTPALCTQASAIEC